MTFEPTNREEVIVRLTLEEAQLMFYASRARGEAIGRLSESEDEALRLAILRTEEATSAEA